MTSNAERVRQFHRAVGSADPLAPTEPNEAVLSLRRALIEEKSLEVLEAFARFQEAPLQKTRVEATREADFHALIHELTDLLYVAYDALVAFGVEPDEVVVSAQKLRRRPGHST